MPVATTTALDAAVLDVMMNTPDEGFHLARKLRKEPRRECLSTIESVAEALEALGEDAAVCDALRGHFARLLARYQVR